MATAGVAISVVAIVAGGSGGPAQDGVDHESIVRTQTPAEVEPSPSELPRDEAGLRDLLERVETQRRRTALWEGLRHRDPAVQAGVERALGLELSLEGLPVDAGPEELAARIDERVYLLSREMRDVQEQLQADVDEGTHEEAAKALRILAALEEDFADAISGAPTPPGLSQRGLAVYAEALEERAEVRRLRADAYVEQAEALLGEVEDPTEP